MRSYKYHEGLWTEISGGLLLPREVDDKRDPFPGLDSPREEQQRAHAIRKALEESYKGSLINLGFTGKKRTLYSHLGSVEVYPRDHVDLPANRGNKEFAYDFLCVLRFAGSYIRVWIVDLPNLFLFLREIEAHEPAAESSNEVADVIRKIFYSGDVHELILNLNWLVAHADEGKLEIAIKQAQPEKQ